ncbi:hypothetical protein P4O66_011899 [Electrophorus voltai]|uniref:Uncharacterized protein n=1 Tax=Electrophorus voltai TaxID=2609070 RepID=A0AAD8Z6P4_9TELE|nr:hypothetical protein P4O66_011899 [Electrophorus voltai]
MAECFHALTRNLGPLEPVPYFIQQRRPQRSVRLAVRRFSRSACAIRGPGTESRGAEGGLEEACEDKGSASAGGLRPPPRLLHVTPGPEPLQSAGGEEESRSPGVPRTVGKEPRASSRQAATPHQFPDDRSRVLEKGGNRLSREHRGRSRHFRSSIAVGDKTSSLRKTAAAPMRTPRRAPQSGAERAVRVTPRTACERVRMSRKRRKEISDFHTTPCTYRGGVAGAQGKEWSRCCDPGVRLAEGCLTWLGAIISPWSGASRDGFIMAILPRFAQPEYMRRATEPKWIHAESISAFVHALGRSG